MAKERLTMRHVKETLRQKLELGRTHREIAHALGISVGVVGMTLSRASSAGVGWEEAKALAETELEVRLYGAPRPSAGSQKPAPDCAYLHLERKRRGVTLELLHVEYIEEHPDGYRYTQFCEIYRRWAKRHRLSMRQVHRAGEKAFLDFSGKKPHYVDPGTGECIDVELFAGVLGASSYTYIDVARSQKVPDWIAVNVRALEFFGGVPEVLVPDQLKSAVAKPCRYEPKIQRAFQDFAEHYGTVVIPARPGKPKDKAKVEAAVLVAQRWVLAKLRHETFFSFEELRRRVLEGRELNERRMRIYGASRRELFERLDRPALRALPAERFVLCEWQTVRVNIDYHVEVGRHYYSVPYQLVHEKLEARVTATTVEVFHRGERVASHARKDDPGHHTTLKEHMPKSHQKHLEWTPSRLVHWASTIGPNTKSLVAAILADRPHPEQGYRSCLGILRLARRHGKERLDAACGRALAVNARSYRHVDRILKKGLDRIPAPARPGRAGPRPTHENVRGPTYYEGQGGPAASAEGGDAC
jgi:transposase